MPEFVPEPWKVSLHGGHSRQYCDHAADGIEDILDAAVAFGYHVFGVTEHAPRFEAHRLYDEERDMGWTIETVQALFEEYARRLDELIPRYADRITLLKGFEAEVIPEDRYTEVMLGLRRRLGFEYMVGSVHWVGGHIIDYRPCDYAAAVAACGGLEKMAIRYYETVVEMVRNLRPEVVGHLDVVSCRAPSEAEVSTPPVRKAAYRALEVIRESGAILDVNTGGYRKGLAWPFPAPWLVSAAREMGIPFCFGDDSHRVAHVGAGVQEAREYLLGFGVESITTLVRGTEGTLEHRTVFLG